MNNDAIEGDVIDEDTARPNTDGLKDPVTPEQIFDRLKERLLFHGFLNESDEKGILLLRLLFGVRVLFRQCERMGHLIVGEIINCQLVAGQLVLEVTSGSETIFFRDSGEHRRRFGDGRLVVYPPKATWYIPSNSENTRPSHGWELCEIEG